MIRRTQNIDLTVGHLGRCLMFYALPIFASSFFQQLYTTIDAIILGQFAGKTGLAAIDAIYNLLKLPVNFFVGLSTGASILISRFFGAKDEKSLLATIISQGFSAVLVLAKLFRASAPYQIKRHALKIDGKMLFSICRLGLPIGIQSALFPIANMAVQRSINRSGEDNIAAWALCGKLFIRAEDADVAITAGNIMRFLAPLYILYALGEILAGAIRGTGDTFRPMLITLIGTCALRILWILLVVPRQGDLFLILSCYPLSWGAITIAFALYYWHCGSTVFWKQKPLQQ